MCTCVVQRTYGNKHLRERMQGPSYPSVVACRWIRCCQLQLACAAQHCCAAIRWSDRIKTQTMAMSILVGIVAPHLVSAACLCCTQVWRISKSLGWVPATATRDQAYEHLNQRVPDDIKCAATFHLACGSTSCAVRHVLHRNCQLRHAGMLDSAFTGFGEQHDARLTSFPGVDAGTTCTCSSSATASVVCGAQPMGVRASSPTDRALCFPQNRRLPGARILSNIP